LRLNNLRIGTLLRPWQHAHYCMLPGR